MTNVALVAHGELGGDRLFDPGSGRDNCLERFRLLRAALEAGGMACRTADLFPARDIDVLLFHDLHDDLGAVLRAVKANPQVRLIYLPNEPALISPLHAEGILPALPADAVLTWNDRLAQVSPRLVKCNIGQPVIKPDQIPGAPPCQREFVCCIYSNKSSRAPDALYAERLRAVEFFSRQAAGIDLYGTGWESSTNEAVRACFRGRCRSKKEVLQRYRFALAFENVRGVPGLITEKIFDCFAAGTVPVYYGAPNVERYLPPACFVDFRRFSGYPDLHDFLARMPEDRYRAYLKAARQFVASPQYHEFTSTRYVEIVTREIGKVVAAGGTARTVAGTKLQLLRAIAANPRVLRQWRRFRGPLKAMVALW